MTKQRKHYTLKNSKIEYIKKYSEQFGISESQALDFMLEEHNYILKLLDISGIRKTMNKLLRSRLFLTKLEDSDINEFDISTNRIDKFRKELDVKSVDIFFTKSNEKIKITDYSKLDFEVQRSINNNKTLYFYVIVEDSHKEVNEDVFKKIIEIHEQKK